MYMYVQVIRQFYFLLIVKINGKGKCKKWHKTINIQSLTTEIFQISLTIIMTTIVTVVLVELNQLDTGSFFAPNLALLS